MEDTHNLFRHVDYLWDESHAATLGPLDRLVYRSNLLGSDQRVNNTGGGNTSGLIEEIDPLTDETTVVLWVKGSGGDLRTANRENFASLYQEKLDALDTRYQQMSETGYKSTGEDAMPGLFDHCVFNRNPRAPSIDTPLHSMIPERYVDHIHAHAVIAIAACKDQQRLTEEVWKGVLAYLPWMRPGWEAAKQCAKAYAKNPAIRGILMGQHGHMNWDEDDKGCYDRSLWVIEQAARFIAEHDRGEQTFGGPRYASLPDAERDSILADFLPVARGLLSQSGKLIATIQTDSETMRFINSFDAERLTQQGTSCPDHFLRTKIKPLLVDWDPASRPDSLLYRFSKGLENYRKEYTAYYERCCHSDSPAMRDPSPTVILIPGVGMVSWGNNKSESRVTAEFYRGAIEVMRGAEAVSTYQGLPEQEAFDIEYWSLEEAKLQRMPAEKPLARDVVVVVGAGDGIGRACAHRTAAEGAHLICADLREEAATETAEALVIKYGNGIGVSGTGISACGPAVALQIDITQRESVRDLFEQVMLAYGGIDKIILTAGVFLAPGQNEVDHDQMFDRSFEVNVKGAYILATEAAKIWNAQKLPGALVLTTSVNGTIAKRGSLAYDSSKAATNHLVRELALELAPLVSVNGLAPATVIAGSSMFPMDRVIASLEKYDLPYQDSDDDECLRKTLSEFYAKRTLLQCAITPDDQAEAAYLLISGQLGKTTGQILTVDGGLPEAFLR